MEGSIGFPFGICKSDGLGNILLNGMILQLEATVSSKLASIQTVKAL
jgi:hypothetical protein